VNKGDEIAVVKSDMNGSKMTVKLTAPKSGVVHAIQGELAQGTVIYDLLADDVIATVGPFPPLNYTGTQETVRVPPGSTLVKFVAKVGDYVHTGDPIARVFIVGVHRPSIGPVGGGQDDALSSVAINSPRDGYVIAEQHLDPGMVIDEAMDGNVIAVVGDSRLTWPMWPMWLWWLLGALAACPLLLIAVLCMCRVRAKETDPPPKFKSPSMDARGVVQQKQQQQQQQQQQQRHSSNGGMMSESCHTNHISVSPFETGEEGPRPSGLRLVWADTRGGRHIVYAQYRPLGIRMQHVCPIVIEDFKFNSYAKQQLDVERGWQLLRVGDHDMSTTQEFGRAKDVLNEHQLGLPVWPLRLDFEDPKTNKATTFHFQHKPIGIEFTNKAPITVKKVYENSPAASFKVQKQWVITRIGSQVKAQELDFAVLMRLLKEGVEPLGDWDTNQDPGQEQNGGLALADGEFDRTGDP